MTENNIQREAREMDAALRRMVESRSPVEVAMADAMRLTRVEADELSVAEARLGAAEQAMGAIQADISRLEAGLRPVERKVGESKGGKSFFRKLIDPDARAAATRNLPELRLDLASAREAWTAANRKRNALLARLNGARNERRRAVKAQHATSEPVRSQIDGWSTPEARERWASSR
ncbi:MAG: hypothetical protein ACR2K4_00470 [Candidatus Limnocylindria bacterium]